MAIKPTDYMKHALLPAKKQRKEIAKRIESQLEATIDAQLLENASRHPMNGRHNVHFFIDDKFLGWMQSSVHTAIPTLKEPRSP